MPRIGETSEVFKCNFYTKSQKQVERLIASDDIYIHDECIGLYNEIIEEELPRTETSRLQEELPKPKEIRNLLDRYAIGQDVAKRAFAVAVYNHYKRITSKQTHTGRPCQGEEPVEAGGSNILLTGPTGCGEVYLAQVSAKMLNVPFAVVNTTALTEAGYVDKDVENVLLKLIQTADFDIKKAETGIVCIDEIGKVTRKPESPPITRGVSGEGVQQALLKTLEGTVASVLSQGGRKHPHQGFLRINTTKVLFIVGRAFAGLDGVINSRIGERPLGSSVNTPAQKEMTDPFSEVRPKDLRRFGLTPEFTGRLPMISTVSPLDREALNRTLVEPRNTLAEQFARLFELDRVQLNFTDEAIDVIAGFAPERGTGARGLRAILEELLLDVVFEMSSAEDIVQAVVAHVAALGKA